MARGKVIIAAFPRPDKLLFPGGKGPGGSGVVPLEKKCPKKLGICGIHLAFFEYLYYNVL